MPNPRRLRDPRALAAIAHPVRMGIVELLSVEGPMTATELADRLDETPANCSWHLRKLAEHDFIEEAEGGKGRQRPWQMKHLGMSWAEGDDLSHEELRAGQALSRMLLERWVDRFLTASETEASPDWRDSAGLTQHVAWLTPDELADVTSRLQEVAATYADRLETGVRPEGSRLCEIVAWGAAVEMAR
ncbi:MAG TPA: helix-turn-helix domain-containing protein [Nocardioides sp.]